MNLPKSESVAIVGAGIAGLTAAIMLEKLGFEVRVFESAEEIRGIGAGMGLASNAIKAFEYLNLDREVISICNHLKDFEISDAKGKIIISADTKRIKQSYNTDNFAVHRADLHKLLLSKIHPEKIETKKKLVDLRILNEKVEIEFKDGKVGEFDFVIGSDGVNSRIRQLFHPKSKPRYAGYWCWRGVVENPNENLNKSIETWGENGRFGITPLTENRIYWYACIGSNLKDGVPEFGLKELKGQFKNYHQRIPEILNLTSKKDLISNPIVDIKPISRYHFDRVLLLGDAAHATTPNMGQGACMAIEDVAVLQDELRKNDWQTACANFEKRRLKRTHYIIRTSKLAGKFAQVENQFLISTRNYLLRNLPDTLSQRPLKQLLEKDFMEY